MAFYIEVVHNRMIMRSPETIEPIVGAEIVAHSYVLPEGRRHVRDVAQYIIENGGPEDTTEEWFQENLGVTELPCIDPEKGESLNGLIAKVGETALEGIDRDEVRGLFVATSTHDGVPAAYIHAQRELGLTRVLGTDISAACSGFTVGVIQAFGMMSLLKENEKVLVIGADVTSNRTNPLDRNTRGLFSDGAGAVVIEKKSDSQSGLIAWAAETKGEYYKSFTMAHGELIDMDGEGLYKGISDITKGTITAALDSRGVGFDFVDIWLPHQSSKKILEKQQRKLKIPDEKFVNRIHITGNSSSATVAETFSIAVDEGLVKKGDVAGFIGPAVGASIATVIFKY